MKLLITTENFTITKFLLPQQCVFWEARLFSENLLAIIKAIIFLGIVHIHSKFNGNQAISCQDSLSDKLAGQGEGLTSFVAI